jgi:hypothetical protein
VSRSGFGPHTPFRLRIAWIVGQPKLCLNGHERLKRQLEKRGIAYEALDNGFLSYEDPPQLQKTCDELGPEPIERMFIKMAEGAAATGRRSALRRGRRVWLRSWKGKSATRDHMPVTSTCSGESLSNL